jgi:SAM-dependent methyltransferase
MNAESASDVDTSHPTTAGLNWPADLYEQGRPEYPEELLDRLRCLHDLDPSTTVVDLGAGTGKLSRLLTRTGCMVTAVEPSADMRDVLARELPEVTVRGGAAEAIPCDEAAVDVVVAGEAFHWFDAPAAWREISRVLRPGGVVMAAWLHRDVCDWQHELWAYLRPYCQAIPAADVDTDASLRGFPADEFSSIDRWSMVYEQPYSMSQLRTMYASYSFVMTLPAETRAQVLDGIEEIVRRRLAVVGDLPFPLPLRLETWSAVRR